MDQISEAESEQHDSGDADRGVEKAGASGVNDFVEIHAEAESDDGGLQQEFRQALALDVKRMGERETVHKAREKSERRRDEAAGCEDDPHEEKLFAHTTECGVRLVPSPSSNFN